jgi:hypothetical protein
MGSNPGYLLKSFLLYQTFLGYSQPMAFSQSSIFLCYSLFSLDYNISFLYALKGWIQDAFNLHDSCGVNNLHGMPGLLSSFLSVFYCAIASKDSYGDT